jgi:hypothetical protein
LKRLLAVLWMLGCWNAHATWYFVGTSCGGGAGATFSLWYSGSFVFQNHSWPYNFTPSSGSYANPTLYKASGGSQGLGTLAGTSDYTIDVCSGTVIAGAPASYSGPMKVCWAIVNDSSVAHEYTSATMGTNGTWQLDAAPFTVQPGGSIFSQNVAAGGAAPATVFGRYEFAPGTATREFRRIGGIVTNSPNWVQSSAACVSTTFYDKGGLLAGQGGVGVQEALDATAVGFTNMVQQGLTNKTDTLSQTNNRIAYAAPTGGALVASDFKTGVSSLKTGLDDISKQLDDLKRGQTNSSGGSYLVSTEAEITSLASGYVSGIAAQQSAHNAAMAGIGVGDGGVVPGATIGTAWPLVIGYLTVDLNPWNQFAAFSSASGWARWIGGWILSLLTMFNAYKMKMKMEALTYQIVPAHQSGAGAIPAVGTAGALFMAGIIILTSLWVPVAYWTWWATSTSSMFNALFTNPLTYSAVGETGTWIARFMDFLVKFVPIDIALVDYLIFVAWRASLEVIVRLAMAITRLCVG